MVSSIKYSLGNNQDKLLEEYFLAKLKIQNQENNIGGAICQTHQLNDSKRLRRRRQRRFRCAGGMLQDVRASAASSREKSPSGPIRITISGREPVERPGAGEQASARLQHGAEEVAAAVTPPVIRERASLIETLRVSPSKQYAMSLRALEIRHGHRLADIRNGAF